MERAAKLSDRYFFLRGTSARPIDVPVGEFWSQLMSGAPAHPAVEQVASQDGWLVSHFAMLADMTSYEMHPEGDEVIHQLSGRFHLLLEEDGGERSVELLPGSTCLVPRGVWHRFLVKDPGEALALTAGRGTRHRPLSSSASGAARSRP
jgi:mannose-6-phosphate isomerase-like protein (cupin superfamily)